MSQHEGSCWPCPTSSCSDSPFSTQKGVNQIYRLCFTALVELMTLMIIALQQLQISLVIPMFYKSKCLLCVYPSQWLCEDSDLSDVSNHHSWKIQMSLGCFSTLS